MVEFRQERQNVRHDLSIKNKKAYLDVGLKSFTTLFANTKDLTPSFVYRCGMMALNWFKLYDNEDVVADRCSCCKDSIWISAA